MTQCKYRLLLTMGLLALCSAVNAHEDHATADREIKQERQAELSKIDIQKLSEALGNFIGRNLENPGMKFDLESVIKGIREGAAGRPSPMTEEEYERALTIMQEAAFADTAETNLKTANDFLRENAKKANIIQVEPEKLQYEVVTEGSGTAVQPGNKPLIHYTGKFLDGTVFGTSQEAGGPITISLDQTIPGFSKLLEGMKEGEKRKLYIHPDLGYGTTGQLPPNSLLIFDVEVIKADSTPPGDVANPAARERRLSEVPPPRNDDLDESIEEIEIEELPMPGKPDRK